MPSSRRTLLQVGLGGAALLALGGVGLGLRPGTLRDVPPGLKVLDARLFSVVAAAADRICPGGGGLPSASELGVAELVDQHLSTLHPGNVAELKQGLLLLENALAGAIFDQRFSTFTGSPPDVQDAVLAAWSRSSLLVRRQVFKALRSLVAASYWGHPDLYAAAGYPGPPDYPRGAAALAAQPQLTPPAPGEGDPPPATDGGGPAPPGAPAEAPTGSPP